MPRSQSPLLIWFLLLSAACLVPLQAAAQLKKRVYTAPPFRHDRGLPVIRNPDARPPLQGWVYTENEKGFLEPVYGAALFWVGKQNAGVLTDTLGFFSLTRSKHDSVLIASYVGLKTDTISVSFAYTKQLKVFLKGGKLLDEVQVEGERSSTFQMGLEARNTQMLTGRELTKAACCNLSESFETNPSVDVNYSDAGTGLRQIQFLGLSGIYTQITEENRPGLRGLAANSGLTYIPGQRIESIQLTKGAGSAANGYESMAGQINVELKKPEKLNIDLNAYVNQMGRNEFNLGVSTQLSQRLSVLVQLHTDSQPTRMDRNHDNFTDIPVGSQLNGFSRLMYRSPNGFIAQAGLTGLTDNRRSGTLTDTGAPYMKYTFRTERNEVWGKFGYLFPQSTYKSIGLIVQYTEQQNNNTFGQAGSMKYNGFMNTYYANFIYQSILSDSRHTYRAGASFLRDAYNETLDLRNPVSGTSPIPVPPLAYTPNVNFTRIEMVPGLFGEYTYAPAPKFSAVAGLRIDFHNLYGTFVTPRLHARYDISDRTVMRVSAGRGQRSSNIFTENSGVFTSQRIMYSNGSLLQNAATGGKPYGGLNPEVSYNTGASLNHNFTIADRNASLIFDYYLTRFQNQVIADYENPNLLQFYNSAFALAQAAQAEFNYSPLKRLEVRISYKYSYAAWKPSGLGAAAENGYLLKPYQSQNRAFVNAGYGTRNKKWMFDATLQYYGKKRLPASGVEMPAWSGAFVLLNAQVTYSVFKPSWPKLDLYIGAENVLDFYQQKQLVFQNVPADPYGNRYVTFDASYIYGPLIGRMVYAGLRFNLSARNFPKND